jgi:large conductance mechanosensitive channel
MYTEAMESVSRRRDPLHLHGPDGRGDDPGFSAVSVLALDDHDALSFVLRAVADSNRVRNQRVCAGILCRGYAERLKLLHKFTSGDSTVLKGFRDFILRGNVVDLAVAVIIGAAFGSVVTALTTDLITPLLSAIVGKPSFGALILTVNGGKILYGDFLNAVIDFLLKASVVYFFIVVPLGYLLAKVKGPVPTAPPVTKVCAQCLSDIPVAAKRCKFCTEPVAV